jgi:hypothetical protein
MKTFIFVALAAAALVIPATVLANAGDTPTAQSTPVSSDRLEISDAALSTSGFLETDPIYGDDAQTQPTEKSTAPEKGPPLPFHVIEGYGGGAITPMAYLVNPPLGDHAVGLPAAAYSYVNLGQKDLQAFTFTENLLGRVEIGLGADRLDLGTLPNDIQKATGVNVNATNVWLYNVNARGLIVPENSFGTQWLPAVTVGAHFKYNDGIRSINDRLGGALSSLGYRNQDGVDFTLTASKTFANVFGRPLIVSVGGRESEAAQLGFLGFADHYNATFEGNIAYLPTDWLLIAYEYRGKSDPYGQIPGLIEKENDWHALDVSWLANSHTDVTAGIGYFGVLANARADSAFWLQLKYEF